MDMTAIMDEVRLKLTGDVVDLELSDASLIKIINSCLREVQRYIDTFGVITVPFKKCIDVIATDNNDVAVKNVLEILEKVDIWSDEIHQIIERPRVVDVKATIVDDDNIEI